MRLGVDQQSIVTRPEAAVTAPRHTLTRVAAPVRAAAVVVADECSSILVKQFTLLSRWHDTHPGVPFQAQPARRQIVARKHTSDAGRILCKYFLNTGRCAAGDACPFAHEHGTVGAAQWVSARQMSRRALCALSGNRYASDEALMHVKGRRAEVFADWLMGIFGADALRAGRGVLDVAGGGAGGLAFALHVLHGVPVTVVDPRPVCVTQAQRKRAADKQLDMASFPHQALAWFDASTWHLATGRSMVVGMHPDQAVDAIVDCALHMGIPFAVVPCCVFPSLMAAARGARLKSREELIAYLVMKRPGEICVDWLPCDGASQVVYWRGPRSPASAAFRHLNPPWWDERVGSRITSG